jgi:hypothetical protein
MKFSVTLEQVTVKHDGQPVRLMHSIGFPSMQDACEFVDDSRRDGDSGDIIRRYTDRTLIEKWTVR